MTEEPASKPFNPFTTEFSSAPFFGTSLIGLRAFKVDFLGNLKSVSHEYTWLPEVNTARCLQRPLVWVGNQSVSQPTSKETPHDGWLTCQCGLYAYVDGSNNYYATCSERCGGDCANEYHRKVSGVVEAWGRMIIGSKGFRAQFARIRGLVLPEKYAAVAKNYPVPVFQTVDELVAEFPLTPTDGLAA